MNVAETEVATAVTIFLNNACNEAASAFLFDGNVWNDNAVIGTNAMGTPMHNKILGKTILFIEEAVFICVSIKIDIAIIRKPQEANILLSTILDNTPAICKNIRQRNI